MMASFPSALTHAFGWSLIHALWQGLMVAFLLGLTNVFLRSRSARLHYGLAVGALCLMLGVWAITFLTVLNGYLGQPSVTFTQEGLAASSAAHEAAAPLLRERLEEILPLLVNAWMVGFVLLSIRFAGGLFYVQRLKTQQTRPVSPYWRRKLLSLQKKLDLNKAVLLLESALVKTPMVVGHIKPVILIPLGAFTRLPSEELEGILLHELGHILRNDYLVNLLQSLVETLFFYHPAVWWLSNRIRTEREHCCDDIAIAASGDPRTFATALYHLQEVHMKSPQMAMAASGHKGFLYQRIKRALGANPPEGFGEKFVSAALLMFCLFSLTLFAGAANFTGEGFSIHSKQVTGEDHTTVNFKENNRDVVLEFVNDEISALTINGQPIPEDQWGLHAALIEEVETARELAYEQEAHLREQEVEMRAQEEVMRAQEREMAEQESLMRKQELEMAEQEALMQAQEQEIRKQEEAFRSQEEQMRVQELEMRAEEEQMRAQEKLMRVQEEAHRMNEARFEEMEEARARAFEEQERVQEKLLKAHEQSFKAHEEALRENMQKLESQMEAFHEQAQNGRLNQKEMRETQEKLEAMNRRLIEQHESFRMDQEKLMEKSSELQKRQEEIRERNESRSTERQKAEKERQEARLVREKARAEAQAARDKERVARNEARAKSRTEERAARDEARVKAQEKEREARDKAVAEAREARDEARDRARSAADARRAEARDKQRAEREAREKALSEEKAAREKEKEKQHN